ncbi:MAG TPA: hypothetical protein VLK27_11710 [Chthoniobacterales bacterium]|nr:hypothetical protein [Chthoniobacterales bacterium]
MPDTEQIRQQVQSPAPFSTWFGIVLLMVVFWVIAVAIIGPAPRGDTYEQQRAQNREKKLKDLRDEDAKALTGYAWIDKNKGSVRIPIERAMELAVTELANKKPTAAGPIAAPSPEASAAPSASPAPSASSHVTGTPKPTTVEGPGSESRGQPAAELNPPPVQPGTQPGAPSPAASPSSKR